MMRKLITCCNICIRMHVDIDFLVDRPEYSPAEVLCLVYVCTLHLLLSFLLPFSIGTVFIIFYYYDPRHGEIL